MTRVLITMGDMGKRKEWQMEEVKRGSSFQMQRVYQTIIQQIYFSRWTRSQSESVSQLNLLKTGRCRREDDLTAFLPLFFLSSPLSVNQRVKQKRQLKSSRFCFCLCSILSSCFLSLSDSFTNDWWLLECLEITSNSIQKINCYLYMTSKLRGLSNKYWGCQPAHIDSDLGSLSNKTFTHGACGKKMMKILIFFTQMCPVM